MAVVAMAAEWIAAVFYGYFYSAAVVVMDAVVAAVAIIIALAVAIYAAYYL